MPSSTKEEFLAKGEKITKDAFKNWLDKPMTRALLSCVPPMENKDMLMALLEAAFATGFHVGEGFVMIEMLTHKDKP